MRILVVLNDLELCNGIASYVMNYYDNLKDEHKMDFLITNPTANDIYIKKIIENGDKVYKFPKIKYSTLLQFQRKLNEFFCEHSYYDIIHCHVANTALFFFKAAKKYNIKIRIIHAHATISSDRFINKVRNDIMQPITNKLATHYFACSKKAGKAVFGKKEFVTIRNAIDSRKYLYDDWIAKEQKNKWNLNDYFVIGTIGRMSEQKNPIFILKIIKKLSETNIKFKFLYVGNGPMEEFVKRMAKELNIYDRILFLSNRDDVNLLYQCMDIFILPSLYEGLPVVGIEAQCSGLPMLVSDTITKELRILESTKFLSIDSEEVWVEEIISRYKMRKSIDRKRGGECFRKSGYEIYEAGKILSKIYKNYGSET